MGRFFLFGFIIGLIFWSISVSWVYDAINYYGAGKFLSFLMSILIISYLSIYFGIFACSIKYFEKNKYKIIVLPSIFFILEWLRSWLFSGFPGQNLGVLFEELWGLLPIIGVSGSSFVIVLIFCIIFSKSKAIVRFPVAFALIFLLLFGPGHYQQNSGEKLKISVVQPLINDIELLKEITTNAKSDIVVWPEAVGWYDQEIFVDLDNKTVIGGFFYEAGEDENTNIYTAICNSKTRHCYEKKNLVPFGEFQPLGNLLRPISSFFNIPNSSLTSGTFNQKKSNWSGLVCWEIVFNSTFIDRVRGTEYIVHISNDSWYGEEMPEMHLKHARARAVESNKWVVRATTDGISQIISPRKEESSAKLLRGEVGSVSHEIYLNNDDTLYIKIGDLPILIFSFVNLIVGYLIRRKYES